jgi:MFS family permease
MSAVATTLGLSALLMGGLVRKLTPRIAIALGVGATGCALLGLGLTSNLPFALAMWALLGFGAAMAAILGPVAIAAEFFPTQSGKILGIINLPIVLFFGPWLVATMLPLFGRETTYLLLAAPLLPLLLLVLRLPSNPVSPSDAAAHAAASTPAGTILARMDFWMISLGIAVIAATGTAYMVHAIPFAESRGMSIATSALILSVYSGAGFVGIPLFGWLADRIGAPRALALSGLVQCVCWAGLSVAPTAAFLFLSAALGIATTPLTTLHGAAMAQIFGVNGVGKAMGYSFAIKLPFLFMAAPAVGYAYVQMADYRPAFLVVAACLIAAIAALIAPILARSAASRRAVSI